MMAKNTKRTGNKQLKNEDMQKKRDKKVKGGFRKNEGRYVKNED